MLTDREKRQIRLQRMQCSSEQSFIEDIHPNPTRDGYMRLYELDKCYESVTELKHSLNE